MSSNSFSARNGRSKGYSSQDLIEIIWENFQHATLTQGLLDERYGYIPSSWGDENLGPAADILQEGEYTSEHSRTWLNRILRLKAEFEYDPTRGCFIRDYDNTTRLPHDLSGDLDRLFDLLEALHEVVSRPKRKKGTPRHTSFDRSLGQELLRDAINEDLALYTTPYRMLENGQIVEIDGGAIADLADEALAVQAGKGVGGTTVEALHQGVSLFMQRGATKTEKKAAIKELSSALESLRSKVKVNLLSEDERDLFNIANNFAIRHQNSKQKGDYDSTIWYDWMFQVNLAALNAVIKIVQSQKDVKW